MEVGLVTAAAIANPQLSRCRPVRRGAHAGSRPSIALAGAQAPCTSVVLVARPGLKVRCGSATVRYPSSVFALAPLPNNQFKALTSFAGTGKSCAFACPLTKR